MVVRSLCLALLVVVLPVSGAEAGGAGAAWQGTFEVRVSRDDHAFLLRVEAAPPLDPARPDDRPLSLAVIDGPGAPDLEAHAVRDALALRLAGDPSLLRPRTSRTDPRGAARASLAREPVVVTRADRAWGADEPAHLFAPGADLGGGWHVASVTPVGGTARAWRWHDGPTEFTIAVSGPVRWSALAALAGLLVALALAAPALLRLVRDAPRSTVWMTVGLTAAFAVLALGVAPQTVMRGNLNGYAHLVSIQQAWTTDNDLAATASPAHALLLGLPGLLGTSSFQALVTLNVLLGVLAVLATFLALRAWAFDDRWTLVLGTALVAANPAFGRFAASEDPMPLVVLLGALVAVGAGLAVRHGRAVGLVLAAAAAAAAPWAKAEAALSVSLAAPLLIGFAGGRSIVRGRTRQLGLVVGALGVAASGAAFGWAMAADPGVVESSTYLAYAWQDLALGVVRFPLDLIVHDPLISPRYVPLALPALALVGVVVAARTRDGAGLAWLLVLWALFARLYSVYPLPFADEAWATRDHVRLTLHALVPLVMLAAAGAAWLRARLLATRPQLLTLATATVVLSLAGPAAYWRETWADQDETAFLLQAARAPERPCVLITALGEQDPHPLARLDLPLTLLDLEGWRGVPQAAASASLALLPERARACAWYYRGVGAYLDGDASDGLRPGMREVEGPLGLVPLHTSTSHGARYGFHALTTEAREIGFFSIAGPPPPGGRHDP